MMRDGHYSKWPNGKGSMCECAHIDVRLCASALGGCGLWVMWGVVHCSGSHNETECSPRLLLTYYSHYSGEGKGIRASGIATH